MQLLRAGLAVVHSVVAATWLGAMLYSLLVVQPRAREFFGADEAYEPFAVALAAGARWKVLGMAAVLLCSGAGLVTVEIAAADEPSALWIALVAAKGALLVVAVSLFAWVSWQLWPARLFARTVDLPGVQRRFRAFALALTAVVASGFVLGAIASSIR